MTKTDRSRILTTYDCPRKRYLEYHYGGQGIASTRLSSALETGSAIHLGLAELHGGASIEEAVCQAIAEYRTRLVESCGLTKERIETLDAAALEQETLVEALLRVYWLRGLPALREEYEVLEAESEYTFALAPGLEMMSRLDGLLRHKQDGDLYVLSYKTARDIRNKLEDARLDLQGITEPAAAEGKWGPVSGVKMEWLVKGRWKEVSPGEHIQDSFLVRPWRRMTAAGWEFAWSYYWPCPGEKHQLISSNGRPWTCKGDSKQHGLGPSWERFPIWECMPVAEWIDMLAAGLIQPDAGDPLASVLYLPPPIKRSPQHKKRLLTQITAAEQAVNRKVATVELAVANDSSLADALDYNFPQNTSHCHHHMGETCPMLPICEAEDLENALVSFSDLGFTVRTPNHPQELEEAA